jgi:hypothetical protein
MIRKTFIQLTPAFNSRWGREGQEAVGMNGVDGTMPPQSHKQAGLGK